MKCKLLIQGSISLLLAGNCIISSAQVTDRESVGAGAPPNFGPEKETKAIPVDGNYIRAVGGKIYDTSKDKRWRTVSGTVYQRSGGILILQTDKIHFVAVTNFTGPALDGNTSKAWAVNTGEFDMGGRPIALWDCGTAYVPPPPTKEQLEAIAKKKQAAIATAEKSKAEAAEKALKWNQNLAEKGDAYGQLRMGERYLAGDGVEKDLTKAREFLSKSAAQGNIEAAKKLEQLK